MHMVLNISILLTQTFYLSLFSKYVFYFWNYGYWPWPFETIERQNNISTFQDKPYATSYPSSIDANSHRALYYVLDLFNFSNLMTLTFQGHRKSNILAFLVIGSMNLCSCFCFCLCLCLCFCLSLYSCFCLCLCSCLCLCPCPCLCLCICLCLCSCFCLCICRCLSSCFYLSLFLLVSLPLALALSHSHDSRDVLHIHLIIAVTKFVTYVLL